MMSLGGPTLGGAGLRLALLLAAALLAAAAVEGARTPDRVPPEDPGNAVRGGGSSSARASCAIIAGVNWCCPVVSQTICPATGPPPSCCSSTYPHCHTGGRCCPATHPLSCGSMCCKESVSCGPGQSVCLDTPRGRNFCYYSARKASAPIFVVLDAYFHVVDNLPTVLGATAAFRYEVSPFIATQPQPAPKLAGPTVWSALLTTQYPVDYFINDSMAAALITEWTTTGAGLLLTNPGLAGTSFQAQASTHNLYVELTITWPGDPNPFFIFHVPMFNC